MAFTMEVPDEAAVKSEVEEQVKPASEEVAQLQAVAEKNVSEILTLDIDEFTKKKYILQSIESFGAASMKSSAAKNSLLQVTVGNLSKDGDESGVVAKSLMGLNRELKDLDPSLVDFTRTGIFGKLFNPVRDYFA
ncbi:MAG: toxic anion resistance protein, partial [Methanosarcinaceae archaeon]|nr:toxic anion resistance protein [Methanosarcinaceae archaeon]